MLKIFNFFMKFKSGFKSGYKSGSLPEKIKGFVNIGKNQLNGFRGGKGFRGLGINKPNIKRIFELPQRINLFNEKLKKAKNGAILGSITGGIIGLYFVGKDGFDFRKLPATIIVFALTGASVRVFPQSITCIYIAGCIALLGYHQRIMQQSKKNEIET
jgi:hypothetical protein